MHSFTIDVQRSTPCIQLSDRCAGKLPEYTYLRLMSKETPRVHNFKANVQGNTQSTHLSDEILSGKYSVETSLRTVY